MSRPSHDLTETMTRDPSTKTHRIPIAVLTVFLVLALAATCGADHTKDQDASQEPRPTLQLIRLSRSTIGGDVFHCIRAGLQTHQALSLVDGDADWQIKIAVTTRPYLARDIRLVHLILLRRVGSGRGAMGGPGAAADYPVVGGYRIVNVVIRPISTLGFANTCHSIVNDIVYRHLRILP